MAGADRSARVDLAREKLAAGAGRYNFYQLVELLSRNDGESAPAFAANAEKEAIHFLSAASIAFPPRDVISLEQKGNTQWQLTASFMGLHGSQSPLPGYYLDSLAWEEAQQSGRLTDFLNVFNHRLLTLLHRIWRKYRYYICFENEGQDAFSQRMFSLVGLGSADVREQLQINHSKMLAYAGLLASPGRSPDVICGLIAHCFELDDVTLHGWQLRHVNITPEQQNRLGGVRRFSGKRTAGRSLLGENFSIGARVPDRSGKFLLHINGLSRQRFLDFLPNGDSYLPLVMFMSFILRDQFAWDLRLGIAQQQVGGMTLGVKQNALLGWTCFLGQPDERPEVTICVRE
ncbi:type VI secretion system baseplate subunit TssG [Enterobacillus tribolii]|uniref:Type VI secretion system protein ImpH n=1 Tax=Enterobacillus tribolii TaxID=1487935 RepID=A0A370QHC9_9GAMM|nr:type VI secretion system baseplate subunit TssG [Enterobacillus tribolii]MBW7982473.1 type VI secretion system baseplate subunit TssG [Enterobacillus tribolii]RDK87752.1 type VI secretion system protein ImpH [Enterobacillus tribolii]